MTRGGIEVFIGNIEVCRYKGQRFDMLLLSDRLMEEPSLPGAVLA
ncbi:hypothetical protein [Stenotrophomonas phage CM2]